MKLKGSMLADAVMAVLIMILFISIAAPTIIPFIDSGKNSQARSDTAVLSGLIAQYKLEIGKYPDNLTALTGSVGQYGPWIHILPKDPWTRDAYHYESAENKFIVFSTGPNKAASSSVSSGVIDDDIGFIGK